MTRRKKPTLTPEGRAAIQNGMRACHARRRQERLAQAAQTAPVAPVPTDARKVSCVVGDVSIKLTVADAKHVIADLVRQLS